MKQALGWILFAVTAIALYWVWMADAGAMEFHRVEAKKRERALKATADSLDLVIVDRDSRIQIGYAELKALRAYYDSVFAAMPPTKELYLRHREEAAARPLSDKWRYLGVVAVQGPVDSAR